MNEDNIEKIKVIDLSQVTELIYENRTGCIDVEASGVVKSKKIFPIFKDECGVDKIFKPLSRTKPLCTPLFAYSEAFCSRLINEYFDKEAPIYNLAICKGITHYYPKYREKGTLVPSVLKENQKLVNLLEYFLENKDDKVNIDNYTNFCEYIYDYSSIFKSDLFSNNEELSKQLANQVLISILTRNQNFHYENVMFIYEGEKLISLAPPIDHEFSTMFMYVDYKKTRDSLYKSYDRDLDNNKFFANQNIALICKLHPDLCIDFIFKLDNLISDLKNTIVIMKNEKYIGNFNTCDYKLGDSVFKRKDFNRAKQLKVIIEQMEKDFDIEALSKEIPDRFISSAKKLKEIINYYINIKSNIL